MKWLMMVKVFCVFFPLLCKTAANRIRVMPERLTRFGRQTGPQGNTETRPEISHERFKIVQNVSRRNLSALPTTCLSTRTSQKSFAPLFRSSSPSQTSFCCCWNVVAVFLVVSLIFQLKYRSTLHFLFPFFLTKIQFVCGPSKLTLR